MKSWSLNQKIYLIVVLSIVSLLTVSSFGLYQMSNIQKSLELIAHNYTKNQNDMGQLRTRYMEQVVQARNMLIAPNKELLDGYHNNLIKGDKAVLDGVDLLLSRSRLQENIDNLTHFKKSYEEWRGLTETTYQLLNDDNHTAAIELTFRDQLKLNLDNQKYLGAVLDNIMLLTEEAVETAKSDYAAAQQVVTITIVLAILAGIGTSTYILKIIGSSIDKVISSLTENSNQVASASQQIAASSQELSQASTEQAASLEETASSIEQMTSMVQKNAQNSKHAYDVSTHSTQSAQKGKMVVQDMIKAIDEISISNSSIMKQVEEGNQKISDILNVISEIGNKTKVINDIVFQTKLLSFNASVEAARAGEHGKGFAVVAEEVGNLAQMSGNAAKEISAMLESSIQKVESIVNETKQKVSALVLEGKSCVESGTKIASQCGEVLEEIVENISNVAEMSHEISLACDEQAQGVQEITRAMNQLDQVTQTNAATSEESASAAEELSSQAESLNSTIGLLFKEIYGQKAQLAKGSLTVQESKKNKTKLDDNILSLNIVKPKSPKTTFKKAAGAEGLIPSENDHRFEEV